MSENNLNNNSITPLDPPHNKPESFDVSFSSDIEKAMMQIVNISENVIHEPTCIICSSPFRSEIEKIYLETKKIDEIKKILKDKSDLDISSDNIENHMLYHVQSGIKELQKLEYISKIRRLSSSNLTTFDSIQLCLSALTERLIGINSITPNANLSQAEVDKIKSAETARLMNAFSQILKIKAMIEGEMKNSGELIVIPRQVFINVFNEAFIEARNDSEKSIINKILTKLSAQNLQ